MGHTASLSLVKNLKKKKGGFTWPSLEISPLICIEKRGEHMCKLPFANTRSCEAAIVKSEGSVWREMMPNNHVAHDIPLGWVRKRWKQTDPSL